MDINVYVHAAHEIESQYPLAYTALTLAFGAWGGVKGLAKLGDTLVKKAASWEDAKLKSAGLSPAQRKIVLEDEARAAERAAADLRAVAAAIDVAPPVQP
jgi:hypothetical protein